ncbi:MAG: SPASM domain-containing protein [Candidatus Cloacimonetes bacterium]|nr:SPASM domain-containing protein [Candidatus Cloacimonadota bacterium]
MKTIIYLIIKSFTWRRFFNAIKVVLSYGISLIVKRPIVWGYPPIVMIEPTNICNLRCPLCPSGAGLLQREKGYMSLSLFKDIIDEIEKHAFMLLLWNQGEPFLNDYFLDMVEYAHKKNLYLMTSTNANMMPEARDIVRSGLDMMLISIDGATQETYNKYRENGDLEKVMKNVKALRKEITSFKTEIKNKNDSEMIYKGKKPNLQIINQFLVMKHNENEIEKIKKMTQELAFDALVLKTVQIYSKEDIQNFLPINPKYRRYKITGDNFELKFGIKNRCIRIWTQPVINWNGEMSVCCFDKDIEYKIGNVSKWRFIDLWKSERMTIFRQTILKNRKLFDFCRNCGEGVSLKIKEKV